MLRFFWTYRKSTSGVIVVGKVQALETFLNFHETSSPLVWQCWLSKDWEEREKVLERANRRHTGQITGDWEGRKWCGSCTFLCAIPPRRPPWDIEEESISGFQEVVQGTGYIWGWLHGTSEEAAPDGEPRFKGTERGISLQVPFPFWPCLLSLTLLAFWAEPSTYWNLTLPVKPSLSLFC